MKGVTKERKLTERQRVALATQEAARAAGKPLSAYAREQGLAVRPIYDAIVGLRRRGVLPGLVPPSKAKRRAGAEAPRAAFVAIDVTSGVSLATSTPSVVCRVVRADGGVIECGAWPDPAWLAAVFAASGGAAA